MQTIRSADGRSRHLPGWVLGARLTHGGKCSQRLISIPAAARTRCHAFHHHLIGKGAGRAEERRMHGRGQAGWAISSHFTRVEK